VSRFVLGALAALAMVAATGAATVAVAREVGLPLPQLSWFERPAGPVTIVLHRHGGQVWAGADDSPRLHLSGTLSRQGITSTRIPAFRGTDEDWSELVRCVQARFDGLAVDIVDEPPTFGAYTLAYFGGTPDLVGYADTVGGIAPHSGRVLDGAMLFVFQPEGVTPRSLCETASHEIGHTLGLDHTRDCGDIMSYESCGPKEFVRTAVACGEWEDRACDDGRTRQSSWQRLAAAVGERPRRAQPEPPTPVVASAPSSLEVRRSAAAVAGQPFSVIVDVRDPAVREVDLHWYARRGHRLRCGDTEATIPFTCTRQGTTYTFTLTVDSPGARKFVVRAEGANGRLTKSPTYRVSFDRAR
jgi:hypothetical protein